MHKKPLVSVVVPYYNGSKYIEETLQSIKNQTYSNIEIIVVNDSPHNEDETKFISSLKNKYDFILVHHDFNMGLNRALASGVKAASGEYYSCIGQDDLFIDDKTAKQVALLEGDKNLVWCYGNMESFNMKTGKRKISDITHTIHAIKNKTIFPSLYYANNFPGLNISASLGRMEIVKKDILPLYYKVPIHCDVWGVNVRLFENYADHITIMDEVFMQYRVHDTNTVHNKEKMLALVISTIVEICPKDIQKQVIAQNLSKVGLCKWAKKKARLKKFFLTKKYNKQGHLITYICRIPVYKQVHKSE